MKAAVVVLGVMVLAAVGVALWRGGWGLVGEGFKRGGKETVTLLPLLVVVFIFAGFVQVLLPRELVAGWLSDDAGLRGIGIAWLAGVLTPGGGPIGLPIAAALLRSGAGPGVIVTYLTSIALLSFVRVPLEVAIYGVRLTVLRVLVTVGVPPLAGLLARAAGPWIMGAAR